MCMAIGLWELQSDLNLKDAANSTEGITQCSVNYLCKRKSQHSHDLLRSEMNENSFVDSFLFWHIFVVVFLFSAFLCSKSFQNN